jgi:aryl-alcohol dehydrogenase
VIASALDALAARGTCATVGVQRENLVLGPRALSGGKCLTAVYEGDAVPQVHIPGLIHLWRTGRLPVDRLIRSYPLSAANQALADMAAGRVIKPVLVPEHGPQ